MSKTITVESNDPDNPKTTLHVSALVEVVFDFETHQLYLGRIQKGESLTKPVTLVLKDLHKGDLLELSSGSPHIAARAVGRSSVDASLVEVEVTVNPEMPCGKLNETVTATISDGSYPPTTLRLNGVVIGNVEVDPDYLRFRLDTTRTATDQAGQEFRVISNESAAGLQLLGVNDPKNLLSLQVDTLVAGKQYMIKAKPNETALKLKSNTTGEITVLTDDAEQPETRISYNIIVPVR